MRRTLSFMAIGLLVFALAALGGFLAGARLAPGHLRTHMARHSEAALGVPVSFEEVGLQLSWGPPWLTLEAHRAEAFLEPEAPEAAVVRIARLESDLDPLALLLGRVRTLRIRVAGADLLLDPDAFPPSEIDPLTDFVGFMDRLGARLAEKPCALPRLEVTGGRLLLAHSREDRPGSHGAALEALEASFSCNALRPRSKGRLEARLAAASGQEGGRLEGRLTARPGRAELSLELSGADLAEPGALGDWLRLPEDLDGSLGAELLWAREAEGPQAIALTALGRDVAGVIPFGEDSIALDLAAPVLRARLSATPRGLALHDAEISQDTLAVRSHGTLGLPLVDAAPLRLSLALDAADFGGLQPLVQQLPAALRKQARTGLSRIEEGRLETLAVEADTDLRGLRELLASDLLSRPGEAQLTVGVADATLRVGERDRVEDFSGVLRFSGDRLVLENVHGRYRGGPLPRLDAELTGLSELASLDDFSCLEPAPAPALPGVRRLVDWVRSRRQEGPSTRTWQRLVVEADVLSHPLLLCAVSDLAARVRPSAGALDFEVERGVWAGVPITATGRYLELDDERRAVAVYLELGAPLDEPPTAVPDGPWARGTFEIQGSRLGRWWIRGAHGEFGIEGSQVELHAVNLLLAPQGVVQVKVGAELGSAEELPFHAALQAGRLSGADLVESARLDSLVFDGDVHGALAVRGHLEHGQPLFARAQGNLSLHAREGYLDRDLPVVLSLAAASRPLGPAVDGDRLLYDAIDLAARIEGGWVRSHTLTAEGPRLRVAAQASVAVARPHALEGIVGMYFFPGLDSLIDRVPLLNRVILGPNRNLVGAYFALEGTWSEPATRALAIRSLAGVPVVEGIGSLLWGGIKRLEKVLTEEKDPPAAPEASLGS